MNAKPPTAFRALASKGKTIFSLFDFKSSTLIKQCTKSDVKTNLYNFNVTGLKKGLYVLQVDRDNETKTTKIIIQ